MNRTEWLACHTPNPKAKLRLFCFPYAGGGALVFREWADILPLSVEVCPVQLPGRGGRLKETPINGLPQLVEVASKALLPYFDKPMAFFGHSMGGLLSFEIARRLRKEHDIKLLHLFVSGSRAPQLPDPNPPIHMLPNEAFIEELNSLNGTPADVLQNPELMQLMLPALRADFAITETYTYQPDSPLGCDLIAFGGLQDKEVSQGEIEAWREQTNGLFTLKMLPGDHFFLNSARSLLLRILSRDLDRLVSSL